MDLSRDNPDLQGAGNADSFVQFHASYLQVRFYLAGRGDSGTCNNNHPVHPTGSRNQDVPWDQSEGSGLHDAAAGLKANVDLYRFERQTALVVAASVLKHAGRCLLATDIVT